MRFFPSQRLALRSMDPPERMSDRLASLVAPKMPLCLLPPKFPFAGKVEEFRFELTCLKWLTRTDRSPLVVGEIAPHAEGCELRAAVELRPFAHVALAAFAGLGIPVALLLTFASEGTRHDGLVLLGCISLGYGFTWLSVRRHAKRFRRVAEEQLGCRSVGAPGTPESDGFGSGPAASGWSRPAA